MVVYAQLVVGPPGSGKTTYCKGVKEFLTELGRPVRVINLDPANDVLPYKSFASIHDLITLSDVMESLKLGPNGSLLYCMEFLEKNIKWLKNKLETNLDCNYYLIDCPGQVELYTHNKAMRNIISQLEKWDIRVVTVHLVDSQYCNDAGKFLSVVLTSLSTMVMMETPHVNVLSKIDLIKTYTPLAFGLDYYTEVLDLQYLLEHLSSDPFYQKYSKLNQCIAELISDYSLVSFIPLNIQAKASIVDVVMATDKACGYVHTANDKDTLSGLTSSVYTADYDMLRYAAVREQIVDNSNEEIDPDPSLCNYICK